MAHKKTVSARMLFLFQKYINNQCSNDELNELLKGIKDQSIDEHLDVITLSLWESVKRNKTKVLSNEYKQQLATEARVLIEKAQQKSSKPVYKLFDARFYRHIAAAAVIVVLLGLGLTFYLNADATSVLSEQNYNPDTYFKSGNAEVKTIRLSDGSQITLNSGTSIGLIKNSFNGDKREIWLEGEAFFNVARNPEKPFIVHYGAMQTTVLGTSFNISAYPQIAKNVVSVRSGKVQVSDSNKTLGVLTKDKELIYETRTGKNEIKTAKWQDATGWMSGHLVFRQSGSEEIKLRLKHQFNIEVEIKDNILSDETTSLNASFARDVKLEEVLKTISLMTDSRYEINNKKIIIHK